MQSFFHKKDLQKILIWYWFFLNTIFYPLENKARRDHLRNVTNMFEMTKLLKILIQLYQKTTERKSMHIWKSIFKELLSNLFELQCCPLTINPFFVGMMCTFPLQKYETSKEWGLGENPAQREIDQHQTSHSCEYCQTSIIFACWCLCLKLHECLNFTVEGILATKTSISLEKEKA